MAIRKLSTASVSTGTKSSQFWDGTTQYFPSDYVAIATVSLSGSQSSISFTSIPQTYKHLQLRVFLKCALTPYGGSNAQMRFNGDTATNYSHTNAGGGYSAGTNTYSAGAGNETNIRVFDIIAAQGCPGFAAGIIDIIDYANTSKYKTVKYIGGVDLNGSVAGYSGDTCIGVGNWRSTSGVTSIQLLDENSTNFVQYSHAALYGIRG
jgi:hypothetical protein